VSKRITVVTSEPLGRAGTGGAGTADSLLAVALGRHGHEVELLVASGREIGILSPEWTQRYEAADVSVRVLRAGQRVQPPYLAPTVEVFEALREREPEVVIADDWRGLAYASLRGRQLGLALTRTAFVVHCHGPARVLAAFAAKVPDTVARFAEEITERASIELADAVVSPSRWLLQWLRDHGWPVPENAAVVQYVRQSTALDEPLPPAPPQVPVTRLAFFGQLREGKGIRIFLDALATLDPLALDSVEVQFLGAASARWTPERIRSSLAPPVQAAVGEVRVETELEREVAIARLREPGTLAVMPSLLDNSPNTVAECIEHGIAFIATATGGIPELVAEGDRERVLCNPTSIDLAAALMRALASRPGFAPARAARDPREALASWLDMIESVEPRRQTGGARPAARVAAIATGEQGARHARRIASAARSVAVDVVTARSRRDGLTETDAEWVVFLDEDDVPDDEMLDVLVAAQAASGADVVTPAVRIGDDVRIFLGDPGPLGLVENQYGVLGLVRRALVRADPPDGAVDPDWPLLAKLALGGARIVSSPQPLSSHSGRPGNVGDVPGEGLAVLEVFEAGGDGLEQLAQLAATLGASYARLERKAPLAAPQNGVGGLARRVAGRILRNR
jgi:glycosyltransferase involved in cell wall biosynthesis